MSSYSIYNTFCGKNIIDFDAQQPLQDLNQYVYRIRLDYNKADKGIDKRIEQFAQTPVASQAEELVIGNWCDDSNSNSGIVVNKLVELKAVFKNLKRLYLGDIESDESEISWIEQSDVSPLWAAFPNLELLKVRGSSDLSFGTLHHARLKIIIVESVGVSKNIIQEIANAQLPDLEHLELYLGHYGFNNTIEDLESIMNGGKFPNLNYLALKSSYIQDEIALKIANAPILDQIEILDLSLGLLTDVGAQALLESSNVKKLKLLNLEYNYISNEMAEKMEVLGIEVRVGGQKIPDVHDGKEYRYIDVIE